MNPAIKKPVQNIHRFFEFPDFLNFLSQSFLIIIS